MNMIFFGTHPTLTHVPPTTRFSINSTEAPYEAARRAQPKPPLPAPNTIKLYLDSKEPLSLFA